MHEAQEGAAMDREHRILGNFRHACDGSSLCQDAPVDLAWFTITHRPRTYTEYVVSDCPPAGYNHVIQLT